MAHAENIEASARMGGSSADDILTLEGINKWFGRPPSSFTRRPDHRNHVLNDVTLSVPKGEVLVIIGPSGSGKSTLLRCINMITPAETGTVTFLGQAWTMGDARPRNPMARLRYEQDLRRMRTRIGMVFQHFNLFPHKTVLKNVMLAPIRVLKMSSAKARERALAELERVGLANKSAAYPGQLSGGQKQRVAIARAMAMRPELMLFDEVTSALDPEIVKDVLDQIKALAAAGMTMIVVTHEMGFAREVGDRIIFMDDGKIVEQGPAKKLISDPQNPRTQAFLRAIL
jgi:arginine/lysine/histidine transport system ATP-binding protein